MKTFLQTLVGMVMLGLSITSHAQYIENFSTTPVGSVPSGWSVDPNTDVSQYQRPGTCSVNDYGLLTPGVGPTAPTGFVLPSTSYNASYNDIVIKFSVFVYDANLKCGAAKPFPCPTYVKAYIVPTSWNSYSATPTSSDYYAAQSNYQILYPNTSNTIVFTNIAALMPAGVTSYRVYLNLKTADNANCVTGGTKFVFDDFAVTNTSCNNCAPMANADYFNADVQGLFSNSTSFKGNVYGGYTMWANQAPAGYEISSLTNAPAINNGTDLDYNSTSLSNAVFTLSSPLIVESGTGCTGALKPGTLTFNSDGTFVYNKSSASACVTRVSFTYTLTTYAGTNHANPYGTTAAAKVTIDLPGQVVGLPVHFKSFSATRQGKQVLLQWTTAMEQNNKGFYLQRSTGGAWKDIGLVFSATEDGNSTEEQSYSFVDLNPYSGVSQYRILQVDFDGRGHYSEIRAVRGESGGSKLTVFPNPSNTGSVMLLFSGDGSKDVVVTDMAGQVVKQYKNVRSNSLGVRDLKNGFYNIVVHDSNTGTTTVEKLIVKER